MNLLDRAEPFRIKMIEPLYRSTRQERIRWLAEAKNNLFLLKSNQVFIDLLSDSGTGAMSDNQWAAMMVGDESYAGSSSYYNLKQVIEDIFSFDFILPVHQGRAAENVLFSVLIKEGDVIPGNSHFDTTKAHIQQRGAIALDCTVEEAKITALDVPFKGNMCLKKLENALLQCGDRIPFILINVTNNSVGGQPISLECIHQVRQLADRFHKRVVFDSARFAENAYFIKVRESGYRYQSIKQIVAKMYTYCDVMLMSCKKDGLSNIGGFIATRHPDIYEKASVVTVLCEGFLTYGGMTGRDMNALAKGLTEVINFDYLESRIKQVEYLGKKLEEFHIPFQHPVGGHAIFVDALKFLPHISRDEFPAQTLALELYLEAGVRGVEIGTLLADRDPQTGKNRYPDIEFLRLAIPRRTFTNNHMDVVAIALKSIYDRRESIVSGYRIMKEAPVLRHFTVQLEKVHNQPLHGQIDCQLVNGFVNTSVVFS